LEPTTKPWLRYRIARIVRSTRKLDKGAAGAKRSPRGGAMLGWAVVFLIVAIIAAIFGFFGIAAAAAGIAKILFFIFIILFLISLVGGLMRRT
jgi:uncharacterized membrane protein YtjA (UPF0391 family)